MPDYRLTKFRGEWALATWEGKRRVSRVGLGTKDRKEAQRKLDRALASFGQPEQVTVTYLWGRYREDNAGKRIAANMEFSGKAILPHFGAMRPEDMSAKTCRAYMEARTKAGRKPGTVWTELNHLQNVFNWASGQNLIKKAPTVEKPPKPPPRNRRLTQDEVRTLIQSAGSPHIEIAIALMAYTAGRIGAILELTWDRVDLKKNMIDLSNPDETGRRKGRATVPINRELRPYLVKAKAGAITDYVVEYNGGQVGSIKKGFGRAVKRAGLEDVTPHTLRHSAASTMAEKGIRIEDIARVLGHSDSRTTERIYAKVRPGFLKDAIAALEHDESDETGSPEPESTPDDDK